MSYYYLISSLPMLKSDGTLPFPYSRFLEMCESAVSESKYAQLRDLSLMSNEGPFLSEWAKFYTVLNKEVTHQRNLRLGRQSHDYYQKDEAVTKLVTEAMNANPLEGEEMLIALEFKKIDDLIGVHYFDDYALIGYAMKLKLLERKSMFRQKEGKDEFERIVKGLEHQIKCMEQE